MDNYLILLLIIIVGFSIYYYFEIVIKKTVNKKENKKKDKKKKKKTVTFTETSDSDDKKTNLSDRDDELSKLSSKYDNDEISINSDITLGSIGSSLGSASFDLNDIDSQGSKTIEMTDDNESGLSIMK